jgi:hypothetical protein
MTLTASRSLLAGGLALSLVLGACSAADDTGAGTQDGEALSDVGPGDADSAANGDAAQPDPAEDAAQQGAGQEAGSDPAPGEPIASLEVETLDYQDQPIMLRIDVLGLARASNDTARLDFSITNLTNGIGYDLSSTLGFCGNKFSVCEVSLVDLAEDQRYLVLLDAAGACVCSIFPSTDTIGPGRAVTYQATFPAPPASTTSVDVQFPNLGMVTEVPVSGS